MSNKINIALVEDYKLVRAGLKSVLDEVDGFNIVFETDKGKEAIDYTINYKPDIVLLDIGLPDINGIRVISEIKKAQLDSRIIVLTANTDFNIINKCLSLGIYAYVLKDIAIETLVNVIKMVNKGAMWFAPRIADLIRVKSKNIMTVTDRKTFKNTHFNLTQREYEVLKLIVDGKSNSQIASELCISEHTAKAHVCNIIQKLVVDDRTQAAVKALKEGIIQ